MSTEQPANMKLAYVLSWASRSGGGVFPAVCGLARATSALDGMHVEVFGSHDPYIEQDRQAWQPLKVHAASVVGPSRLCYSPAMARMIDDFHPDLVHSSAIWTYHASVVNRFHTRTHVPYVLTLHGTLNPRALRMSRAKKAVARVLFQDRHFRRAACIHALTDAELASVRAFGLKNPVCVIPNGVDVGEAVSESPDAADPLPVVGKLKAHGYKVLLYLGRIHPGKGLATLLRAWAETRKHRRADSPGWLLAIGGWDDGGHQAELLQLCGELGLSVYQKPTCSVEQMAEMTMPEIGGNPDAETSVLFLGPQFGKEKQACYRHCDACILPSFFEGLPMSVLEAWNVAKPVLMTPQCNLPEGFATGAAIRIVQDEHHAEAGVRSIAAGLQELFDAPDSFLRAVGNNGRRLVVEKFAWPEIARQMKSVYDWVLEGGEPPACVRL